MTWDTVRVHRRLIVSGGLGLATLQVGFFAANDLLGVALGTVTAIGSGPMFAGAIETWLGRRPPVRWVVATAVSVAGGALMVFAVSGERTEFDLLGLVAALACGFGFGVYYSASKRLVERGVPATAAVTWQYLIGALPLLVLLLREPVGWTVTPSGMALAAYLGVATIGIAYWLFAFGLRTTAASTAATLALAEPVTATVVSVAVLDDTLSPTGWLGAAIVVAGLAVAATADATG